MLSQGSLVNTRPVSKLGYRRLKGFYDKLGSLFRVQKLHIVLDFNVLMIILKVDKLNFIIGVEYDHKNLNQLSKLHLTQLLHYFI